MITLDNNRISPPVSKKVGNLEFYCSRCSGNNFLFHGNYRYLKKSNYSINSDCHAFTNYNKMKKLPLGRWKFYFKEDFKDFEESIFFSNGKQAIIIPKKYL